MIAFRPAAVELFQDPTLAAILPGPAKVAAKWQIFVENSKYFPSRWNYNVRSRDFGIVRVTYYLAFALNVTDSVLYGCVVIDYD